MDKRCDQCRHFTMKDYPWGNCSVHRNEQVANGFCAKWEEIESVSKWIRATAEERELLKPKMSRRYRHRGIFPSNVFLIKRGAEILLIAMQYVVQDKWVHWSLQAFNGTDFACRWWDIMKRMRPLIGNRMFIEVFPNDEGIIDTAPVRWFWVPPFEFDHTQFDLRQRGDD